MEQWSYQICFKDCNLKHIFRLRHIFGIFFKATLSLTGRILKVIKFVYCKYVAVAYRQRSIFANSVMKNVGTWVRSGEWNLNQVWSRVQQLADLSPKVVYSEVYCKKNWCLEGAVRCRKIEETALPLAFSGNWTANRSTGSTNFPLNLPPCTGQDLSIHLHLLELCQSEWKIYCICSWTYDSPIYRTKALVPLASALTCSDFPESQVGKDLFHWLVP